MKIVQIEIQIEGYEVKDCFNRSKEPNKNLNC